MPSSTRRSAPSAAPKSSSILNTSPSMRALVETWRAQNEALRGAFARIAREPMPLSLSLSQPLTVRAAAVPINTRRLDLARAARQRRVAIVSAIAFLAGSIAAATGAIVVQHLPEPVSAGTRTIDHGRAAESPVARRRCTGPSPTTGRGRSKSLPVRRRNSGVGCPSGPASRFCPTFRRKA